MRREEPSLVEYSPYAYEAHEDPYPIYAALRAEAPVYRNDELDFWALALHEDVLAALKDAHTFSNSKGVSIDRSASQGGAGRPSSSAQSASRTFRKVPFGSIFAHWSRPSHDV